MLKILDSYYFTLYKFIKKEYPWYAHLGVRAKEGCTAHLGPFLICHAAPFYHTT